MESFVFLDEKIRSRKHKNLSKIFLISVIQNSVFFNMNPIVIGIKAKRKSYISLYFLYEYRYENEINCIENTEIFPDNYS